MTIRRGTSPRTRGMLNAGWRGRRPDRVLTQLLLLAGAYLFDRGRPDGVSTA